MLFPVPFYTPGDHGSEKFSDLATVTQQPATTLSNAGPCASSKNRTRGPLPAFGQLWFLSPTWGWRGELSGHTGARLLPRPDLGSKALTLEASQVGFNDTTPGWRNTHSRAPGARTAPPEEQRGWGRGGAGEGTEGHSPAPSWRREPAGSTTKGFCSENTAPAGCKIGL